jgi:hypothetical protein
MARLDIGPPASKVIDSTAKRGSKVIDSTAKRGSKVIDTQGRPKKNLNQSVIDSHSEKV